MVGSIAHRPLQRLTFLAFFSGSSLTLTCSPSAGCACWLWALVADFLALTGCTAGPLAVAVGLSMPPLLKVSSETCSITHAVVGAPCWE